MTRTCTGACGDGIEVCTNGMFGSCIGRSPSTEVCDGVDNNCNGLIDEVRIYNRALTAGELQTDMNTPIGAAPPPSPIGVSPTVRK